MGTGSGRAGKPNSLLMFPKKEEGAQKESQRDQDEVKNRNENEQEGRSPAEKQSAKSQEKAGGSCHFRHCSLKTNGL